MKMVLAVMYREYLIRTTSMTWAFLDLVAPLTYLLLFGVGLNRAIGAAMDVDGTAVPYNAFFLAGVLSMASFGIAINTSYGFFVDRDNGMLYEFLSYPMTRGEFIIGKILFNALLTIAQSAITLGLGSLLLGIGLRVSTLLLLLPAVILGTAGWFFFLATFALRIRRNDVFNTVLNVMYFLLMFGSSIFYPLEHVPGWLRSASAANPLTWHTDVLRYLTIGAGAPDRALLEAAAFMAFLLLSFAAAVRTLQRGVVK